MRTVKITKYFSPVQALNMAKNLEEHFEGTAASIDCDCKSWAALSPVYPFYIADKICQDVKSWAEVYNLYYKYITL